MTEGGETSSTGCLRRWADHWEVDRAVFYALLARGWQFVAGPISLVLIALYFSPETQGYFYTFAGLMGLQILVELGLHTVVINVASHEWARLGLDSQGRITGQQQARERLISLGRQVTIGYGLASVVFVVGLGIGGVFFLGRQDLPPAQWLLPWWCLVILTGCQLWTMPLISILEGCNQVAAVNRCRFSQAIVGNLAVWAVIVAGGGLWAAVASAVVKLVWELHLVGGRYRRFFAPLVRESVQARIDWRREVWPLQWTLAIHSVLQYLAYFLFAPVMFHFHGSVVAGRMGMTWTILTTLQYAAFSWVQARTPRFGMLIAERNFVELDRLFFRVAAIACGVLFAAGGAFWLAILVLNQSSAAWALAVANRLLGPGPTATFALSVGLIGVFQCQATYLLAHKRNPLLWVSVLGNSAIILGAVWAGAWWGPQGAGLALLLILALFTLPATTYIWHHRRRDWHQ